MADNKDEPFMEPLVYPNEIWPDEYTPETQQIYLIHTVELIICEEYPKNASLRRTRATGEWKW